MARQQREARLALPGMGERVVTVPFTRDVRSERLMDLGISARVTIDHNDEEGFFAVSVDVGVLPEDLHTGWHWVAHGEAPSDPAPSRLTPALGRVGVNEALSSRALQSVLLAEVSPVPDFLSGDDGGTPSRMAAWERRAASIVAQDLRATGEIKAGSSDAQAAGLALRPRKGRRMSAALLQEVARLVRERAVDERPFRAVMARGYSRPQAYALISKAKAAGYLSEEDLA